MFDYRKEKILIDELIKDRNELSKVSKEVMENLEKRIEKLEYEMFRQWKFNWLTNLAIFITTINVLILAWTK